MKWLALERYPNGWKLMAWPAEAQPTCWFTHFYRFMLNRIDGQWNWAIWSRNGRAQ